MRTIAVEEHFVDPRIRAATQSSDWARRTRELGEKGLRLGTEVFSKLEDLGEIRTAAKMKAGRSWTRHHGANRQREDRARERRTAAGNLISGGDRRRCPSTCDDPAAHDGGIRRRQGEVLCRPHRVRVL